MFNKFFKFLQGYVIIKVYGKGAEKFLNICLKRDINVWGAEPIDGGIMLCMSQRDFMGVRTIAKKSAVSVRIIKKIGMKQLFGRYKKRYMFAAGLVLCIIFFAVSSQFVWLVEVNGVKNSDAQSIWETLDRIGVKSGALKSKLPDGFEMQQEIVDGTDNIAWAWVYIEGAKARVEIYEKSLPPEVIDKSTPCDIVSSCDGVIKKLSVKNGEAMVKVGDAVRKGDVIVSGKVSTYKEGYPEKYIYVHAIADVLSYTSYTEEGEYKLYYENRTPTGRKKTYYSLELFGKLLKLPQREIRYDDCDTTEKRHEINIPFFGYSGIALNTVCKTEVTSEKKEISAETAVEWAKNDLEEKISQNLKAGSLLEDEKLEYTKTDDETINVRLRMDFVQNIAEERKTEEDKGEEILDKQTD